MADPGSSLAGEKRASSGTEANSPKRQRRSSLTDEKAPADNEPTQPTDNEPTLEEPTDDEPTLDEEPTDNEPTPKEPTEDEPTLEEEPTDDEPTLEEPTDDEPTVEEPTDDEPTVEEPTEDEPTLEEPTDDEPRDPGKRAYKEFSKLLKTLGSLKRLSSDSVSKENKQKILDQLWKLRELCQQTVAPDEEPNPWKMVQIQLKHTFLNSEKISEEDNVKNFLMGLEDSSASKSDRNSAVFVFLANFATELWYQWEEGVGQGAGQWSWTPDWEFWMPCSETVVSGGQWKGETPAPENVEIINYLNAIRPIPSDEQYLPPLDIATLFKQLHGLKDPEISESLRAVVAVLEDVPQKRKHTTDFIEKLQKELAED